MNRAKSADAHRKTTQQLMDTYGQRVLNELKTLGASSDEVQIVYARTFLSVLDDLQKRVGRKLIQQDPEPLLLNKAKTILAEIQLKDDQPYSHQPTREASMDTTGHESVNELRPSDLQARMDKLLKAALLESEASRRHRGPAWTAYALGLTVVFGTAAIAFGIYHGAGTKAAAAADNEVSTVSASFPPPLTNFPVTVKGQLLTSTNQSLNHVAVTSTAAYSAHLTGQGKPGSPKVSLYQSLYSSGKFSTTGVPFADIQLQTPRFLSGDKAQKVKQWNFQIMQQWGVLTVQWQGSTSGEAITQVYLLNMATKSHALATAFKPEAGGASSYTVAVGKNKVIVQGVLPSNSAAASTGLPITVYKISGSSPHSALQKWKVLSSVPGQLERPAITTEGIISQGYAGARTSPDTLNATWYLVNWQGGVTEEVGPPLDGRPHWTVQGEKGTIWWAETTPSGKQKHNQQLQLQVLIGSLSDASVTNQPPALSLNGAVNAFHVANGYMEWIQDTQNVPQLVVARVQ